MEESTSRQTTTTPFVDKLPDTGVSKIDPSDPAAPPYRLLAKMRSPLSLRDLMILPVRTGYIGQQQAVDPSELPKSTAELYPDVSVSDLEIPSTAGRIRCQVFRRPLRDRCPMMRYVHGGGFTVGQSEDTAYHQSNCSGK
ncbi:MAG: hypothetical protein WCD56_01655 [Pseudolabrys sp.]